MNDPAIETLGAAAAPAVDPGQTTDQQSAGTAAEPADTGFVSAKPLLMIGAAGDDVAELGYLLAGHGFPNLISQGKASAPPILDDALMQIVVDFQAANGINPWASEGSGAPAFNKQVHIGVVDARTWEALLGYQPKVIANGAQA